MTDIERVKVFADKKNETINRILGDVKFDKGEDKIDKRVDVNWNRGKSWYDDIRLHPNQNAHNDFNQTCYQLFLRDNGGVVVTVSDETLSEEAPVIK